MNHTFYAGASGWLAGIQLAWALLWFLPLSPPLLAIISPHLEHILVCMWNNSLSHPLCSYNPIHRDKNGMHLFFSYLMFHLVVGFIRAGDYIFCFFDYNPHMIQKTFAFHPRLLSIHFEEVYSVVRDLRKKKFFCFLSWFSGISVPF